MGYATPIATVATGAPHGSARPVGAFPRDLGAATRPEGPAPGRGPRLVLVPGPGRSRRGGRAALPRADAREGPGERRGAPRGRERAVSSASSSPGQGREPGAAPGPDGPCRCCRWSGLSRWAGQELACRLTRCFPFSPLFGEKGNARTPAGALGVWWPGTRGVPSERSGRRYLRPQRTLTCADPACCGGSPCGSPRPPSPEGRPQPRGACELEEKSNPFSRCRTSAA